MTRSIFFLYDDKESRLVKLLDCVVESIQYVSIQTADYHKIWLFQVAMADWEGVGILLEGQQLLFLKPFDFTDFF